MAVIYQKFGYKTNTFKIVTLHKSRSRENLKVETMKVSLQVSLFPKLEVETMKIIDLSQ